MAINNLNEIIQNEIKIFLSENITSIVYHFCSFNNLLKMIKDDAFRLTPKQLEGDKNIRGNDNFYLCVTRQSHGNLGYSRSYPVRIVLDGNLLMNNYHGKAYNFFGKGNKSKYHNNKGRIDRYQEDVENEDRIYSKKPYIENIRKYIKCVDINTASSLVKYYVDLKKVIDFFGEDFVNLYNDNESFILRKLNNRVSLESLFNNQDKTEMYKSESYDVEKVFDSFVSILFYAYKNIYKPNETFSDFCNNIIEEFNLEDYSNEINDVISHGNFSKNYVDRLSTNIFNLREINDIDEYKIIMRPVNILLNINRRRD